MDGSAGLAVRSEGLGFDFDFNFDLDLDLDFFVCEGADRELVARQYCIKQGLER